MGKPKVSITMTAYNAEAYIEQVLQSIFEQSLSDFEVILVDDGSTDETWRLVQKCTDKRLTAIQCEHNYIHSLNCAQQLAQGEYIARMDADDLMHPHRLALQVALMERHKKVDICTGWIKGFNMQGYTDDFTMLGGYIKNPLLCLLRQNQLYHPTAMIRRAFWEKHNLQYLSDYAYAEDYKMWADSAIKGATFYVLPQVLHYYRTSNEQVSNSHNTEQREIAKRVQEDILAYLIAQNSNCNTLTIFADALHLLVEKRILTHREMREACIKILQRT